MKPRGPKPGEDYPGDHLRLWYEERTYHEKPTYRSWGGRAHELAAHIRANEWDRIDAEQLKWLLEILARACRYDAPSKLAKPALEEICRALQSKGKGAPSKLATLERRLMGRPIEEAKYRAALKYLAAKKERDGAVPASKVLEEWLRQSFDAIEELVDESGRVLSIRAVKSPPSPERELWIRKSLASYLRWKKIVDEGKTPRGIRALLGLQKRIRRKKKAARITMN